jgi:hypothetical protein
MSKKSNWQILNETRRRVEAEVHAGLLESALTAERAKAAAPPPAPPPPPPAPPPPALPSKREEYLRLQRTNPYLASQFLLNHEHEIYPPRQSA